MSSVRYENLKEKAKPENYSGITTLNKKILFIHNVCSLANQPILKFFLLFLFQIYKK